MSSSRMTVAMAMARCVTVSTDAGHPHLNLLMAGKVLKSGKAQHTGLMASSLARSTCFCAASQSQRRRGSSAEARLDRARAYSYRG
jgi:hypothetical protein